MSAWNKRRTDFCAPRSAAGRGNSSRASVAQLPTTVPDKKMTPTHFSGPSLTRFRSRFRSLLMDSLSNRRSFAKRWRFFGLFESHRGHYANSQA
jgi:hypothetical protein